MEDKRTAIAILLCMFLFMFWFEWVMAPYKARQEAQHAQQIAASQSQQAQQPQPSQQSSPQILAPGQQPAPQTQGVSHPSNEELSKAATTIIESDKMLVAINHLGGRLSQYLLKEYKASLQGDKLLDMVVSAEGGPLPFGVYIDSISDDFVNYTIDESSKIQAGSRIFLPAGDAFSLSLRGKLPDGREIRKTFTLTGGSYLLSIDVEILGQAAGTPAPWIEWSHFDTNLTTNQRINHYSLHVLGENGKVKILQLSDIDKSAMETGNDAWVSLGDKYFMAALIAPDGSAPTMAGRQNNTFFTRMKGGPSKATVKAYIGPKDLTELSRAQFQLERNIDLGWFSFIAHPLLGMLRWFYSVLGNFGLAIVLLTLMIKTLFLPLTKTSFHSMKGMQEIQPEMKALRERIQDPTQLNREMMALYKKHGVNPMGGCFPMLIQLPVFLGLYNALNNSIELRHAHFALWVNDLSSPERLELLGMGIPVMVILMGLSMLLQQITTPSAADPQQKKMMLLIPIIFTFSFIIFPFPSGLVLYWFINNLISIVQQMLLRREGSSHMWSGTLTACAVIFFTSYILTLL